jgi:hypothetical protein
MATAASPLAEVRTQSDTSIRTDSATLLKSQSMPGRDHLVLSRADQSALLASIVRRSARMNDDGTPPVVVFDLDGTLMDNRPRTCAILHEFASVRRGHDPALSERLLSVHPDQLAYLFSESLERLGVEGDVALELHVFWRERFFADPHLRHDVEVPGAVAFTRACYNVGASIVYLSGRDLPQMGVGTFQSLRDLGFPLGVPGTELVLKPESAMPDAEFKRETAPLLARIGRVVASFDNEPGNCNVFLAHHPEADSVLVDTQHMPGAPPLEPGVRVITDFVV